LRDRAPRDVLQAGVAGVAEGSRQLGNELLSGGRVVVLVALGNRVRPPPRSEVEVEQGVEGQHVSLVLDHRGGEGGFHGRSLVEAHVLQRTQRVEVLAHRNRHAGVP
jgi:hypothetical protein